MVIPVVILFLILSLIGLKTSLQNKNEQNIVLLITYVVLIFIAMYRSPEMADYSDYKGAFDNGSFARAEVGYVFLMKLIKGYTNNFVIFIGFIAIISVGIKLLAIKSFANSIPLSLVIYVSNIFILHDMIQMRAAIASGIILFLIYFLVQKKYAPFIILLILGSLFHQSIILILAVCFFNTKKLNRKVWALLIPIGYLMVFAHLTIGHLISYIPIPMVQNSYDIYMKMMAQGKFDSVNLFNALLLVRICIAYTFIYFSKNLSSRNIQAIMWIKTYVISILLLLLFSDIPVIAVRGSELLFVVEILLLPMIVYVFKKDNIFIGRLTTIGIGFVILLLNIFYIKLLC